MEPASPPPPSGPTCPCRHSMVVHTRAQHVCEHLLCACCNERILVHSALGAEANMLYHRQECPHEYDLCKHRSDMISQMLQNARRSDKLSDFLSFTDQPQRQIPSASKLCSISEPCEARNLISINALVREKLEVLASDGEWLHDLLRDYRQDDLDERAAMPRSFRVTVKEFVCHHNEQHRLVVRACERLYNLQKLSTHRTLKQVCRGFDGRFVQVTGKSALGLDISLRQRVSWLKDVIEAVTFLHDHQVIHRDIKCENILIHEDLKTALLSDLSCANGAYTSFFRTASPTIDRGTRGLVAPEVLEGKRYSFAADVYQFGITIVELLLGFVHPSREENMSYVLALACKYPSVAYQISQLHKIAECCTRHDPSERLTGQQTLEMITDLLREWDVCKPEVLLNVSFSTVQGQQPCEHMYNEAFEVYVKIADLLQKNFGGCSATKLELEEGLVLIHHKILPEKNATTNLSASIISLMEMVLEDGAESLSSLRLIPKKSLVKAFVLYLCVGTMGIESSLPLSARINCVISYLYCFKDLWCSSTQLADSTAETLKIRLAAIPKLFDKLEFSVLCHANVAFINVSSPPEAIVLRSLLDRDLPMPHTYREIMKGETQPIKQDWGADHIAQLVCDGWYTLRPANGDLQSTQDTRVVGCWNTGTSNIRVSQRRGTHESNKAGMVFRRLVTSTGENPNILLVDASLCPCEQTAGMTYVWWNNYSLCLKITSHINKRGLAWAHPVHRERPSETSTGKSKIRAVLVANLPKDNAFPTLSS